MKESVTKFDLEAAFKALDEIEIPKAKRGIKANRPALTEIFSRKSKFDSLFEEYYDISTTDGLDGAKDAREAEIAKAKLERIEKIVDLDAESPEDLLTSYVGKYIMQCPQCMTLFYKNKEDIVEDEDDQNTVNVSEVCQHCGNDSGYTLVGKVGEAEAYNNAEMPTDEANGGEELDLELPVEDESEETSNEDTEDLDFDLDDIDLDEEPAEDEEKTEESFAAHTGETLVEEVQDDPDLDTKLEAHSEYIEYLRTVISQEEEALEKTSNEQVKAAIQRHIDAFNADLESALPDAVKNDTALPEESTDVEAEDDADTQEESYSMNVESEALTEALHEDADLDISDDEFEELINSPEFKKPISDSAVNAMLDSAEEESDETVSESLAESADDSITEGNVIDLAKAVGKGIANAAKGAKNLASAAIDKLGELVKTREEKADWLLKYTLDDYKKAEFTDKGAPAEPQEQARKFAEFLVVGFKEKNSHRQLITRPQPYNTKGLIPGDGGVKELTSYKEADNFAKGWSIGEGKGPAFIYLAKGQNDKEAVFLCEYFKGKLEFDQVGTYFKMVSKYYESAWLTSSANSTSNSTSTNKANTKQMRPAFEDINTNNNFKQIMEQFDNIQDNILEAQINKSLVETYKNVAEYKLLSCAYINNQLLVEGVVHFTSGNTRNITYNFSNGHTYGQHKFKLYGLNEKLGKENKFVITCCEGNDKTLVTESFACTKTV